MIAYTYQISQWRRFQNCGIPLLDTTVKSGAIHLAPTWEMVLDYKSGKITDQQYSSYYRNILDYWWFQDPYFFDELLKLPKVAFGCYCKAHGFCHRYLLIDFLTEVADVEYAGELGGIILE